MLATLDGFSNDQNGEARVAASSPFLVKAETTIPRRRSSAELARKGPDSQCRKRAAAHDSRGLKGIIPSSTQDLPLINLLCRRWF